MPTKTKEQPASAETPEEPSVPASDNGATPEPPEDQQEENPQLSPEDAATQLREILSTPEGQERVDALMEILGPDYVEKRFGTEIERRAQSRADRANWQAQLNDDVRTANEWFAEQRSKLLGDTDEKVADSFAELGAQYVNQLRDHQIKYALKSHKAEAWLTDEDRSKIDSAKGEKDPAAAIRRMVHVYLERAYQQGIIDSEGVAKQKVEKQLGAAEKLAPLLQYLGPATKPPVTSPAAGKAPPAYSYEELEAAYGSGTDGQGNPTSPEVRQEYLRRRAEREKRG